jgi:hypothetical protein
MHFRLAIAEHLKRHVTARLLRSVGADDFAAANFLRPCLIEGVRRRSSYGLYSVFFKQTAVGGHNRSLPSNRDVFAK